MSVDPLLRVAGLSQQFNTRHGLVHALHQVSISLARGETLGLVGESGSGKSVLAYAIMGISDPAARISEGHLHFSGIALREQSARQMNDLRGRELAMIFQNPRVALNPIRKVGQQIEDVLARHSPTRRQDLKDKAIALLRQVRIPDPAKRYQAYPFELSGGQCQRVMIALALSANPALLIADEPTTGLDVTTQAAIMALIREAKAARQMACLLITHDLGLASENCDRIAVMHAGHIVELAPTAQLFTHPQHPYTKALLKSLPGNVPNIQALQSIPGNLPDLRRADLPPCRYSERCPSYEKADCDYPLVLSQAIHPKRFATSTEQLAEHLVACHRVSSQQLCGNPFSATHER